MLYFEELDSLQRLLHYPEEVAHRLTEVEYELFYSVPPIAYVRHVTTDLRTNDRPLTPTRGKKSNTVDALIRRFREVG